MDIMLPLSSDPVINAITDPNYDHVSNSNEVSEESRSRDTPAFLPEPQITERSESEGNFRPYSLTHPHALNEDSSNTAQVVNTMELIQIA